MKLIKVLTWVMWSLIFTLTPSVRSRVIVSISNRSEV
jgi:hypothetical protein